VSAPALWIVGCGAMAGAILHRWVACGMDAARVTVIDPGTPNAPAGVRCLSGVPDEPPPAWLMLGVKPQLFNAIVPLVSPCLGPDTTLLSILAGTTWQMLADHFPHAARIVRVMPNLPVSIGQGAVALHGPGVNGPGMNLPERRDDVTALMTPLGLIEWIDDEAQFDAVTALSGSGPAFVYRFAQALAQGGVTLGLAPEQADRLARATVAGAAALALASPQSLAALAEQVASKGGSTRAGLDMLDADGALQALVTATLTAAEQRNAELALISQRG
jgi:pyrroline-5-carboxylate reductase